jgi:predicted TIM-barrel fold metal-dependent hydrolase
MFSRPATIDRAEGAAVTVTVPFRIVDAHHHVWDPDVNYHPWLRDKPVSHFRYGDYGAIRRRYLVPDYLADAKNWNVAGSVYVEAEWDPADPIGEMDYIATLRRTHGYPSVAVGQIWLDRDDAAGVLERLADHDFVRSVRQKPRANAAPSDRAAGGMTEARWREGFARLRSHGLRFDLQTPWWHLHEAADLARAFPDTPIIVNHAGLPTDRSPEGIASWRAAMAGVASCRNVAVKISGIGRPGHAWTANRNREVVLTTIGLFGVERCMFGSNFPVDGLCATFDEIYGGFGAITQELSASERQALFHDNAVRIYAIPQAFLRTEPEDQVARSG